MLPLTKEKNSYDKQKFCYICKKEFSYDNKSCYKFEITAFIPENIKALHIISIT